MLYTFVTTNNPLSEIWHIHIVFYIEATIMKISKDNLLNVGQLPMDEELVTTLARSSSVEIGRIVSTGQTTGWQRDSNTEFVLLVQGKAAIEFDGGNTVLMDKGDWITIKPNQRHRVTYTSSTPPCIWLCIFY
jgi:cupin 2 domain-containing protein